jgi:hypothetical protein
MSVFSAIECCEEAGTAREDYNEATGIMTASVVLRCAYGLRHQLAQDILVNRRPWPKQDVGVAPTAATASIVPVITTEGGGSLNQTIIYGHALVTVNYSTAVVDLVTESIEPTAEFITLDYRRFRWGAANGAHLTEEEAPGLLIRGINFVRTELDVSLPVNSNVFSLIGHVNNAPLTGSILQATFPTETLLYAPPSISTSRNSLGQYKAQLVKKFTYKPEGWNVYFRGATSSWEEIYLAGGAVFKSYQPANLNGLL